MSRPLSVCLWLSTAISAAVAVAKKGARLSAVLVVQVVTAAHSVIRPNHAKNTQCQAPIRFTVIPTARRAEQTTAVMQVWSRLPGTVHPWTPFHHLLCWSTVADWLLLAVKVFASSDEFALNETVLAQ